MIFIFGMQINIDVFIWACATRHAQSTQNKKFASFCNISRKAWRGGGRGCEVDFLPANEPESFRQVDSITLGLRSQAC